MPHEDAAARAVPVNQALWTQSFPHLRAADRAHRRRSPLRPLRIHPPEALVGGQRGGDRRRGARDPAEHRPGRGLRDDERALARACSSSASATFAARSRRGKRPSARSPITRSASRFSSACRPSGRRRCASCSISLAGALALAHGAAHAHRAPRADRHLARSLLAGAHADLPIEEPEHHRRSGADQREVEVGKAAGVAAE